MTNQETGLSTRSIHSGDGRDPEGSPHIPVYTTTTFRFNRTSDMVDLVEGRREGNLYTRYGSNPTIRALEQKLASLENAESGLAFGSGMAALSSLCLAHGRNGVVCIGDAYGGTVELLRKQLPLLGIGTHLLLRDNMDALHTLMAGGVRFVLCETPANPTLQITDLRKLSDIVHSYGGLLAVDNTFATPVNQQVLDLGADLAVHSATKYLGGHSDITAGAIMGPGSLLEPINTWRRVLGQTPSPETAALLSRSIRTLVVRVQRQNATALAVARAMAGERNVRRVCYPGLEDFPDYRIAVSQMSGFGGMLSLDLGGGSEAAARVAGRLTLFSIAASLGGVESLVSQPVLTSHRDMTSSDRLARGITDSMIRLSIGLEDAEDLISDLRHALAALG